MGKFVDQKDRRSDNDALYGGWTSIVSGPQAGKAGVFEDVTTLSGGYPLIVTVRTLDARSELLSVNYTDCRPAGRPSR